MWLPGTSFLSSVCSVLPSVLLLFSSPSIFSFLLSDCHFATTLVISGKIWRPSTENRNLSCQRVHHYHLRAWWRHLPELTLVSISLYCCTKSPIMSWVYMSEPCHSAFSRRYSILLLALFKMKLIMDSVVSCTAVLESCTRGENLKRYSQVPYTFKVF